MPSQLGVGPQPTDLTYPSSWDEMAYKPLSHNKQPSLGMADLLWAAIINVYLRFTPLLLSANPSRDVSTLLLMEAFAFGNHRVETPPRSLERGESV